MFESLPVPIELGVEITEKYDDVATRRGGDFVMKLVVEAVLYRVFSIVDRRVDSNDRNRSVSVLNLSGYDLIPKMSIR